MAKISFSLAEMVNQVLFSYCCILYTLLCEMAVEIIGKSFVTFVYTLQISIGWLSVISSVIPLALIGFYL